LAGDLGIGYAVCLTDAILQRYVFHHEHSRMPVNGRALPSHLGGLDGCGLKRWGHILGLRAEVRRSDEPANNGNYRGEGH
jgi:hypothetical protein